MEDVRSATAPATPKGRYRLRTHELALVILPRVRAPSWPTKREEFTAVQPARQRRSIARAASPCRGRAVLESIAFDPFNGSESFRLLLQNPATNCKRREDPRASSEFRKWLSQHFPQLLRTFQTLRMLSSKIIKQNKEDSLAVQDELIVTQFDETDEEIGTKEEEQESDDEAWRLIFRYATVVSAGVGETIAVQSITRTESVYFLLNGHCELSFQPILHRDGKLPSAPSTFSSVPAGELGFNDRPVIHLRELSAGDYFGLDAAAFGFEYLLSTATAGSARQRNFLGLREVTLTYVLCLPYLVIQQLQSLQYRRQNDSNELPLVFPYSFPPEAEVFLRNTFLFRGMTDSSRRFLAAHLHPVVVAQKEYLFTPGQSVQVFIIITGQLTLGSPREQRSGGRLEADLELELLQAHDSVGLAEALHLKASFERHCVVTSANGARAYALPSTILLMVLSQEASSLKLVHEWIAQRTSWFELRRATALAQRKRFTAEGSEHVVRLTLAAQRRSKLTCSRCGWAGHVPTSSSCACVDISMSNTTDSPVDNNGRKRREGCRAARQQEQQSQNSRRSECSDLDEATTVQQLPIARNPVSPTSPPKTPAHRRLQVDSIVLRALQISRLSIAERLQSNEAADRGVETQEEQHTNSKVASRKDTFLRSCALAQSLKRLDAALQHNKTPPVQQDRR